MTDNVVAEACLVFFLTSITVYSVQHYQHKYTTNINQKTISLTITHNPQCRYQELEKTTHQQKIAKIELGQKATPYLPLSAVYPCAFGGK